jgi:hypothetical protein
MTNDEFSLIRHSSFVIRHSSFVIPPSARLATGEKLPSAVWHFRPAQHKIGGLPAPLTLV